MNSKFYSIFNYFFVALLVLNAKANAQDSTFGKWMVEARVNYGFVIAHRPAIVHLQTAHVFGLEAGFFRTTNGEKDWQQAYDRPLTGIGFQYFKLGDDKELGSAFTLFPQVLFPLIHSPHLLLSTRAGCGISYIEKTFDRLDNYKNVAIGTHVNCVITFGVYARAWVRHHTQVVSGIEFTHTSNGGFKVPNLGLNMPTLNIGVSHFFGKKEGLFPSRKIKTPHTTIIELLIAGGMKEVIPPEGKKHGVCTLTGTISKSISTKSNLGIGLDAFYDHSIGARLKFDNPDVPQFSYSTRYGIHVTYEMKMGKLSMLFENGIYFLQHLQTDGSIYTRLCLRYHFSQRYFACLNLKSHFGKADYFEYGIGMRLKHNSSAK